MSADIPARPSVWLSTAPGEDRPAVPVDGLQVDVCVVGAGITGLTTALLLKQRGARVAVVERHRIAAGTTGYTTAKLSSLHGLTYAELAGRLGDEKARLYGEANQTAIERIRALVAELAIDCDLTTAPAYTYTNDDEQVGSIEAEADTALRLGLPAAFTTGTDLPYPVTAAVRFDGQAHLHPRRYCLALARAVEGDGSIVVEGTAALDVSEEGEGAVVTTSGGDIRADQVVLATLLPFLDRGGFFAKNVPTRSYAMAVRLNGEGPKGMYLSADSPTRSVRPLVLPDGPALVVGGDSHPPGEADTTAFDADLEAWARRTFSVAAVDQRWSAQDYRSADGVPYVGRSPRTSRTFVATGFKKWGMTNGTAAAMLLADLVTGRDNPWLAVFDATRIGDTQTVKQLISQNLEVGKRFVRDHLARLRAPDVEHLQPGQGGLVEIDGKAAGAYRHPDGRVEAVGLTCTHLGCAVRWNAVETTWDCPCHGSRFSTSGRVLEGPAVRDLPRVEVDEA